MYRRLDWEAAKKTIARYERVAGAKFNFAVGCLEGWSSSVLTFPLERRTRPHPWGIVRDGPPSGAELVGSTKVGTWLRKRLTLKGRAEAWATYIFLRSFTDWLYSFCLRALRWHCNDTSPNYCGEVKARWSVDRSVINVPVMGTWECLIWRDVATMDRVLRNLTLGKLSLIAHPPCPLVSSIMWVILTFFPRSPSPLFFFIPNLCYPSLTFCKDFGLFNFPVSCHHSFSRPILLDFVFSQLCSSSPM